MGGLQRIVLALFFWTGIAGIFSGAAILARQVFLWTESETWRSLPLRHIAPEALEQWPRSMPGGLQSVMNQGLDFPLWAALALGGMGLVFAVSRLRSRHY